MNERLINENSIIKGKLKHYTPYDFVSTTDRNYTFENSIAVFSEPTGNLVRGNFKADFYEKFTEEDFLNTDRINHTVYFIKSTKKDSSKIIEDIQQGIFFNP